MQTGAESVRELEAEEPIVDDEIEESTETQTSEDSGTSDAEEVPENETPRQTVERLLREQDKDGNEESEKAKTSRDGDTKKEKGKSPVNQERPPEEEIVPPQRLSAIEKEKYSKLPKWAKISLNRMVGDHEGQFTQAMQKLQQQNRQASRAVQESRHILDAVRPYFLQHPDLMQAGYTEATFVQGLIGAHIALTDPKTRIPQFLKMGRELGIDIKPLENALQGKGVYQPNADVTNHPQFLSLQKELNDVRAWKDSIVQQQQAQERQMFERTVDIVVNELEQLRNQTHASGQFLYPKMHDGNWLERAKPLVIEHVRATPGISHAEAMRRAYAQLEGGDSAQQYQTRLPVSNNNDIADRAARAAVSVRGKVTPQINGIAEMDVPEEALVNPTATVEWLLKHHRRGE